MSWQKKAATIMKTKPPTCILCGGRQYDAVHAVNSRNEATRRKAHEFCPKTKDVPVNELVDYAGTLDDLIAQLEKLRVRHGGEAGICVDAGTNNVQFLIQSAEHLRRSTKQQRQTEATR